MLRAAKSSSSHRLPPHPDRRGLLLLEAVLATLVVSVGLVFIVRGFATHLRAIRSVEEYATLLPLARGKLLELESKALSSPTSPAPPLTVDDLSGGTFSEPYQACEWTLSASLPEDPETYLADASGSLIAEVTVMVRRHDRPSATVRLMALWPTAWFPPGWVS